MFLVLGLGNPGARYARTRHNVGWRVLDELARRWNAEPGERTETYVTRRARRSRREVELMWPLTFMNAARQALEEWRRRHEAGYRELVVVSDDVYLPVGAVRLRPHGSSGGHQGLASIEASLGTREYGRVRVGVGSAPTPELREHVLDEFDAQEEAIAAEAVVVAADALECWIGEGVLAAMNRFNRRVRKEVPES